jgi:FolB domain-containing protein
VNEIQITGLKLQTRIGVPEEERAADQDIEIDLRIGSPMAFDSMGDDIVNTIDYAAVCLRAEALAAARPRALIETLAWELGNMVFVEFGAEWVDVEIRKFILPNTRSVAVRCRVGRSEI